MKNLLHLREKHVIIDKKERFACAAPVKQDKNKGDHLMKQIPRNEYPRPQLVRDAWLCLNGEWDFSIGEKTLDRKIMVPYACETW